MLRLLFRCPRCGRVIPSECFASSFDLLARLGAWIEAGRPVNCPCQEAPATPEPEPDPEPEPSSEIEKPEPESEPEPDPFAGFIAVARVESQDPEHSACTVTVDPVLYYGLYTLGLCAEQLARMLEQGLGVTREMEQPSDQPDQQP